MSMFSRQHYEVIAKVINVALNTAAIDGADPGVEIAVALMRRFTDDNRRFDPAKFACAVTDGMDERGGLRHEIIDCYNRSVLAEQSDSDMDGSARALAGGGMQHDFTDYGAPGIEAARADEARSHEPVDTGDCRDCAYYSGGCGQYPFPRRRTPCADFLGK